MRHHHYHHWFGLFWLGATLVSLGAYRLVLWLMAVGVAVFVMGMGDYPVQAIVIGTVMLLVTIVVWAVTPVKPKRRRGRP